MYVCAITYIKQLYFNYFFDKVALRRLPIEITYWGDDLKWVIFILVAFFRHFYGLGMSKGYTRAFGSTLCIIFFVIYLQIMIH